MITREKIFFLLFGLAVFFIQPIKKGFELGGHLGWVSSHSASVIIKATPTNHFVGYSLHTIQDEKEQKLYFDRYPFLFSAVVRAILSPFEDNIGQWIFAARQVMNLIFLLSVFYGYRILSHFPSLSNNQRLMTIGLTFTSYYFLEYKSMIHFDQPAVLGMLALCDSIFLYKNKQQRGPLIFWGLLSPLLGRGYASLFIFAGWLLLECKNALRLRSFKKFFLSLPLILTIVSTTVCSSFLAYNIYTEAKLRKVELTEVSIVQSALKRLGARKYLNEEKTDRNEIGWGKFLNGQLSRLVKHINPYSTNHNRITRSIFALAAMIFFIFALRSKNFFYTSNEKWMWTLLLLSGPLWTFTMKKLTAYHDYTMMYYFGFSFFFFATILKRLGDKRSVFVVSSFLIFTSLLLRYQIEKRDIIQENLISFEVEQIKKITSPGQKIYFTSNYREFLRGRPYIMGLYFFDYIISLDAENADWIISKPMDNINTTVFKGQYFELSGQEATKR